MCDGCVWVCLSVSVCMCIYRRLVYLTNVEFLSFCCYSRGNVELSAEEKALVVSLLPQVSHGGLGQGLLQQDLL